ncbi:MAG: 30S ribosomal protein S12 methylthiotransferase RimO [Treponema sp.]|nr:30S ribosomal protein S12 methylthiotransferase RimO [Treponema sp.]
MDLFGCAKNQVDAETMMAFLGNTGWEKTEEADDADLIIVNSCGFIESAKKESINAVLLWRRLYPEKKILLAGCLAQRYAAELSQSLPEADLLFGNTDLEKIGEAVSSLMHTEEHAAEGSGLCRPGERPLLSFPGSAYVKISEGCNNRCSFCAIPLIRGPLKCRGIPDITEECRDLLDRGIKEFCLVGQDLGSFTARGAGLPELLEKLSDLPGDFWVRLLYIHPDHFPVKILDLMERDPRFLPYFDIPFQHASEGILQSMNRRGNADAYLELVDSIRTRLPAAVIRSTFLLGFPGESEKDFETLLRFQEKAELDWLGCFTWSREEDTPAFSMKGRVAKKLALERKRITEERQIPITERRMDRFVGQELTVLVEEALEGGGEDLYLGRSYAQAPEVDGAMVISTEKTLRNGSFVRGRIYGRAGFDLEIRV